MATQWNAEDESAEEVCTRSSAAVVWPCVPRELCLSGAARPPPQDYEFDAEEGGEEELFEDDDAVSSVLLSVFQSGDVTTLIERASARAGIRRRG